MLHPRSLAPLLRERISRWPVTVLTGARQAGKTTLVRELLPRVGEPAPVYVSLDDPDERLRLAADPVRHLDHGDKLIILDEIQKQPDLLDAVKLLADRRAGHRFLLLGSSQILLLQRVRETLAGRATLLDLWPLALIEKVESATVPGCGLDVIWRDGEDALHRLERQTPDVAAARVWRARCEDHLRWGGYPALGPLSEEDRPVWLRDFRRTYLERDLADLGRVADLDQFALAQNLLAARSGQLLSYSEVARDLGVAVNTVKRYVRFLEISYQVVLLRPLAPTLTSQMVKSPKLYWTDPGLARLLSERTSLRDGSIFETFVFDEILRWASWQRDPPAIHFYRTRGGREVDFIVYSADRLLAIECKATERPAARDASAAGEVLRSLRLPRRGNGQRVGLLVSRGRDVTRLARQVWAVPDWRLFGPA